MAVDMLFADLSPAQRKQAEDVLAHFDQEWNEKRLSHALQELPPAGDALRRPLLLGLVRADMRRRWKIGQKATVETYLRALPELGEPAPTALLIAEYEARLASGAAADLSDFARRFPEQSGELRRFVERSLSRPAGEAVATPHPGDTGTRTGLGADPEYIGRYRILRRLGKGGMGTVYLAQDTQLDRQVALKVPQLEGHLGDSRERFFREARAAAMLNHPNICPVFDAGEADGRLYLAMAFIEGRPLDVVLKDGKALGQRQAAILTRKIALAMAEAHEKNVIHRDLKPANIMLDKRGEPVIMDFGLARRMDRDDERLTKSGALLGTPAYMSPEQVNGEVHSHGPLCDVYSLGAILYKLLAGQSPYQGPTMSILAQVMTTEPRPLVELRPDIDPALAAISRKAMARKPEHRYSSMRMLAAALHEWLQQSQTNDQPITLALDEDEPPARSGPRSGSRSRSELNLEEEPAARSGPRSASRSRAQMSLEESDPAPPAERSGPRRRQEVEPTEVTDEPVKVRRPPGRRPSRKQIPPWVWIASGGGVLALVLIVLIIVAAGKKDSASVAQAPTQNQPTRPIITPTIPLLTPTRPTARVGIPPSWKKVDFKGSGFIVWMPGIPAYTTRSPQTGNTRTTFHDFNLSVGETRYLITYGDLTGTVPVGKEREKYLVSLSEAFFNAYPGTKKTRERWLTLDSYPVLEVTARQFDRDKEYVHLRRFYVVGQRLFIVAIQLPGSRYPEDEPLAQAYLDSFRLVPQ